MLASTGPNLRRGPAALERNQTEFTNHFPQSQHLFPRPPEHTPRNRFDLVEPAGYRNIFFAARLSTPPAKFCTRPVAIYGTAFREMKKLRRERPFCISPKPNKAGASSPSTQNVLILSAPVRSRPWSRAPCAFCSTMRVSPLLWSALAARPRSRRRLRGKK